MNDKDDEDPSVPEMSLVMPFVCLGLVLLGGIVWWVAIGWRP